MKNKEMLNFKFLLLCFLFSVLYFNSDAQHVKKTVQIGLIADPQYAEKEISGSRYYRKSLLKLDTAVSVFNKASLDFSVVMGDFVDQGIKDLPAVMSRLEKLKSPVYGLLGNHDYVDAPDKDSLFLQFRMPSSYYKWDVGNWTFIILNTNELSKYASTEGTAAFEDWNRLNANLKNQERKNAAPWNGGISTAQLSWLQKQLAEAEAASRDIIIFTHHPLFPENGFEALNNREILAVMEKHPHIRAVISGHHHEGNFVHYKGIPMITLEGMIETESQNAYGIMRLFSDRIEIEGNGRLTSRILKFE
ncbi:MULTISPECIES: metallophosphoesterase [unclassified Sphingobacterium]|uniref:metallophosphoesterase n=1 Tax=unclassified Sphingobacterium TaxID=2609468 RepID=UPI0025F71AED|nr:MULTISPECIES: metallophosphoesterase [unclassified Sphingobacterium]